MADLADIFGQTVRARREARGISQEGLAAAAEIHRTYMSLIERGKVQVSVSIAYKLAVALDLKLSQLMRDMEKRIAEE